MIWNVLVCLNLTNRGHEVSKGWMVENVVIAGINLGLTLRNQFADLVKSTGSVAGAIDSWTFESVSAN